MTTVAQVARRSASGRRPDQGLPGHRRRRRAQARARPRRSPRQRHQARQRARRGLRPAHAVEFEHRIGPAGYIGPVGTDVPILMDEALDGDSYICGANKADSHLRGVQPGRDFAFTAVDVRSVEEGDTVDGHPIRIEPAIEIGNIFKLGTRYSVPLGATYLDEYGSRSRSGWAPTASARRASPPRRSSSSPTRRASRGRARWRRSTSTWSGSASRARRSTSWPSASTSELRELGLDVIYDDRDLGPGREVRRRRAARRAAAAHGRQAHARGGRDRGAGPARARDALRPARGGGAGRRGPLGDAPGEDGAAKLDRSAGCRAWIAPARRRRRRCRARRCARGRSRTRSATSGWR